MPDFKWVQVDLNSEKKPPIKKLKAYSKNLQGNEALQEGGGSAIEFKNGRFYLDVRNPKNKVALEVDIHRARKVFCNDEELLTARDYHVVRQKLVSGLGKVLTQNLEKAFRQEILSTPTLLIGDATAFTTKTVELRFKKDMNDDLYLVQDTEISYRYNPDKSRDIELIGKVKTRFKYDKDKGQFFIDDIKATEGYVERLVNQNKQRMDVLKRDCKKEYTWKNNLQEAFEKTKKKSKNFDSTKMIYPAIETLFKPGLAAFKPSLIKKLTNVLPKLLETCEQSLKIIKEKAGDFYESLQTLADQSKELDKKQALRFLVNFVEMVREFAELTQRLDRKPEYVKAESEVYGKIISNYYGKFSKLADEPGYRTTLKTCLVKSSQLITYQLDNNLQSHQKVLEQPHQEKQDIIVTNKLRTVNKLLEEPKIKNERFFKKKEYTAEEVKQHFESLYPKKIEGQKKLDLQGQRAKWKPILLNIPFYIIPVLWPLVLYKTLRANRDKENHHSPLFFAKTKSRKIVEDNYKSTQLATRSFQRILGQ